MIISSVKKKIYFILGTLSGIYFILLTLWGVNFSTFWLILGVVFFALGGRGRFCINSHNKLIKKIKVIFRIGLILIISSFVIIQSLIIYNGVEKDMKHSDYLVVLGARVRGKVMSLALEQRMRKSLEYLEEFPNTKIILSGGQGPGENITEAEAMKKFLLSHGINEKNIIKEERSTSTAENFKYTKKILDKLDSDENVKVSVITTNFHMFRAKFLAKRVGIDVYNVPCEFHILLVPNYYMREYFAVVHSIIFDRIDVDEGL